MVDPDYVSFISVLGRRIKSFIIIDSKSRSVSFGTIENRLGQPFFHGILDNEKADLIITYSCGNSWGIDCQSRPYQLDLRKYDPSKDKTESELVRALIKLEDRNEPLRTVIKQ